MKVTKAQISRDIYFKQKLIMEQHNASFYCVNFRISFYLKQIYLYHGILKQKSAEIISWEWILDKMDS